MSFWHITFRVYEALSFVPCFWISNIVFMLDSAGNTTAEKSAEVTEKPLKSHAVASEVWSLGYCSIGCGYLLLCWLYVMVIYLYLYLSRQMLPMVTVSRSRPSRRSWGRNASASRKWRSRPKARVKQNLVRNRPLKEPWRERFLLKSVSHRQALHHLPPPLRSLTLPFPPRRSLFVNWSPSDPRLLWTAILLLVPEGLLVPQSLWSRALLHWRLRLSPALRAPAA